MVPFFKPQGPWIQDFTSRLEADFNRRSSELFFDIMMKQPLFIYIALYQCFNSFTTLFYQFQEVYDTMVSTSNKNLIKDKPTDQMLSKGSTGFVTRKEIWQCSLMDHSSTQESVTHVLLPRRYHDAQEGAWENSETQWISRYVADDNLWIPIQLGSG